MRVVKSRSESQIADFRSQISNLKSETNLNQISKSRIELKSQIWNLKSAIEHSPN